jgi:tRNA dimethylallyltransferase
MTSPLVAILGPTASGKSALGVWLAERLDGEVVACDSTQQYRGFDIGTAKPSLTERRGIPHHLLDILEPRQSATAGDYRQWAIAVLDDLRRRARLPVFTVGTGLYLRALLEGLADAPPRSEGLRERLRDSARSHSPGHLHRMLHRLDRETSQRIARGDEQKLIRAIEVCLLAKRPLSQLHREARAPLTSWHALKIGLAPPREKLYAKINVRVETMLENGWVEEVRRLLAAGLPEDSKPFDFIGYRECRAHIRGEMTLEDAKAAIAQATRRYAKRQMTWFRKESGVAWLGGFGDEPGIQEEALRHLKAMGVSAGSDGAETRSV